MNNIKLLSIATTALAITSHSYAWDSPEVGLVLDGSSTAFQVDRFDPTTGLSLGTYATSYLVTPLGLQEVGNITHVFTQDPNSGGILDKVYNMSTGQFLTTHTVGYVSSFNGNVSSVRWIPGASGHGAYIVEGSDSTGVYTYDTDVPSHPILAGSGGTPIGQMAFDQASSTLGIVTKFGADSYAGYFSLNQADPNSIVSLSQPIFASDTYDGTNGGYVPQASLAFDGSSSPLNSVVGFDLVNFSGGVPSHGYAFQKDFDPATGADSGFNLIDYDSGYFGFDWLAFGHTTNLYDLSHNLASGQNLLYSYNAAFGQAPIWAGVIPLNGITSPLDFAVYAAPEPSALLAFAPLAIGFMLRRRKALSTH